MKKSLLLLLVAMSVSLGGFAQKGRQAVGVDVPFRMNDSGDNFFEFDDESLGFGIKYQYNMTDYIRIEPIMQYYFAHQENDNYKFIGAINTNFFFYAPARFRPYGIVGLGYSIAKEYCDYCGPHDYSGFYIQCGLGIDYRLSHVWSWQLSTGWQGIAGEDDYSGIYVSTGVTYNF
ncbi:MAG: outer membrane beta-barrel protein [Bacteroidaceae bacterium]|nr:outer membrane beta-barrel protein [Bacteroidaceae bacterium]